MITITGPTRAQNKEVKMSLGYNYRISWAEPSNLDSGPSLTSVKDNQIIFTCLAVRNQETSRSMDNSQCNIRETYMILINGGVYYNIQILWKAKICHVSIVSFEIIIVSHEGQITTSFNLVVLISHCD